MKTIDWILYGSQALSLIASGMAAALSFLVGNVTVGIIWVVIAVLWAVAIGFRTYWAATRNKRKK